MRTVLLFAVLLLAACGPAKQAEPPAEMAPRAVTPPRILTYQMRPPAPQGNRLAPGRDGKALYEHYCGACHLTGGMGTNLLARQRIALGESPEKGLLSSRSDLTADDVKQVVRMGRNSMPGLTRVDLTDAELASVAAWLGKGK